MIYSMTAYAEQESYAEWGSIRWELKSVNHRYLEISIKMPESVRDLELSLREIARRSLGRGKIECTLKFLEPETNQKELNIDLALVENLIALSRRIETLLETSSKLSPLEIMKWPNVIKTPELNLGLMRESIQAGFTKALEKLLQSREKEGLVLGALIKDRLQKMENLISSVKLKIPLVLQAYKERLLKNLQELPVSPDPVRLEQEMIYAITKLDVEEELDRFTTHVSACKEILESGKTVGRQLDFLMQELNREANTLASKSIDAQITQIAVELKVLIEQIREQIQNLV